jgi:peptide/nickel transport system permease protein
MTRYMIRRFLLLIPTLLVPLLLMFLLLQLTPGDPAVMMLGEFAPPEQLEALRERLGVNQPIWTRLAIWFGDLSRLDLGTSIFAQRPVWEVIKSQAIVTVHLTVFSLLITVIVGVTAGVVSALYRNTFVDQGVMFASMFGVSLPQFWFGLNLIAIFSVALRWFPVGGYVPLAEGFWASNRSLTLPAVTLGLIQAGFLARITRSSILDVVSQPFVNTARSKGIPERTVILKHVLRPALIPIVTVIGISLALLLSGAVAVEVVFTLPGLGRSMVSAVARRDYPLIQGIVLVIAAAYVVVNLIVDLLYAVIDPRVRYQ